VFEYVPNGKGVRLFAVLLKRTLLCALLYLLFPADCRGIQKRKFQIYLSVLNAKVVQNENIGPVCIPEKEKEKEKIYVFRKICLWKKKRKCSRRVEFEADSGEFS
jgi:hypothetical protein